MRLLKGFFNLLAFCSLALSIAMAIVAVQRTRLPYNSQGRYFDETSTMVLHEQTILVFWTISIVLFLIALASFVSARRFLK